MSDYRMYEQAFNVVKDNDVSVGDIVQPFNGQLITDGICPTLTTRPERFKTAILVVTE